MDVARSDDPPRPGLRERKKAKTRALIQEHALHLFHQQGYEATSIQDIADAAEVSPTTVVRYFPAKSDLVIADDMDAHIVEAVRAQPADLGVLQVMRNAVRSVFAGLSERDVQAQYEREQLMWQEPELRAAMLQELIRTVRNMVDLVAERLGRPADDPEVLAVAGAGIGVSLAAWFACEGEHSLARYVELFDAAIARLESAFRL